jgi:SPP1 family predicted phage head-tail adaptor
MQAGRLTEYISLQRATIAQDSYGAESKSWSTYATAWARIETLTAVARLVEAQLLIDATHRVTIRWTLGVLVTDRISWGDRLLDIVSVIDADQRHESLVLECREKL